MRKDRLFFTMGTAPNSRLHFLNRMNFFAFFEQSLELREAGQPNGLCRGSFHQLEARANRQAESKKDPKLIAFHINPYFQASSLQEPRRRTPRVRGRNNSGILGPN